MCLKHKTIYTNQHHIAYANYDKYTITIPCNDCVECWQEKENEWKLRTYYEYLDCIRKGGYCIWDTLTYNEKNIPTFQKVEKHIPDKYNFTCFNFKEIQQFIAKLRDKIGYDAMRYIIASEYGQTEEYIDDKGRKRQGTKRPHYHLLLFITNGYDKIKASKEIKKTWGKGKTYGIEDAGAEYFWEKGIIDTKAKALKVAEYIGKYCLKNPEFDKTANDKIRKTLEFFYKVENNVQKVDPKKINTPEWRKRRRKITNNVKDRHLQSKGYGKYMLEYNKEKTVIKDNMISMPSNNPNKPIFWAKMPMYYQRKIFYNHTRINGKVFWYLNETGKQYKLNNIQKTIELYAKRLAQKETIIQDQEFENTIKRYYKDHKLDYTDQYYKINDLLYSYRNGRTWEQVAEYYIYYKGRVYDGQYKKPKEITYIQNIPKYIIETDCYYNYCHVTDIDNLGHQIISLNDLGDKDRGYKQTTGLEMKPKNFAANYTINENTWEEFEDLDKLNDILETADIYIEWEKRNTYLHKKKMRDKRKNQLNVLLTQI